MTCIVGIVENGKVHLGADSAATAGWEQRTKKQPKVFRNTYCSDMIIGSTGSIRMAELLQYAFEPPLYDTAYSLESYIATGFVDALRNCWKKGGVAGKENEVEKGGTFLLGIHGRLLTIYSELSLITIKISRSWMWKRYVHVSMLWLLCYKGTLCLQSNSYPSKCSLSRSYCRNKQMPGSS